MHLNFVKQSIKDLTEIELPKVKMKRQKKLPNCIQMLWGGMDSKSIISRIIIRSFSVFSDSLTQCRETEHTEFHR